MEADFVSKDNKFKLFNADCRDVMLALDKCSVDMIYADPPYFLSGGGITCRSGKMTSVNKGLWDTKLDPIKIHKYNVQWLSSCKRILADNGTIWVSGTRHNIYSVGFALQQLGFKLLNDITWEKANPPPNLSCRYFTHSTETILWAAKSHKSKHIFNYDQMKSDNGGKQMKSVWHIGVPKKAEKSSGKHPTQKPLALLYRIICASTNNNDMILDPFCGSGTTTTAAIELQRKCIGIEIDKNYYNIAIKRFKAIKR